jgi:hypothetical protein
MRWQVQPTRLGHETPSRRRLSAPLARDIIGSTRHNTHTPTDAEGQWYHYRIQMPRPLAGSFLLIAPPGMANHSTLHSIPPTTFVALSANIDFGRDLRGRAMQGSPIPRWPAHHCS